MPDGLDFKDLAILGRMGSQRELHLGARSVLFIAGCRICIAACSVRSSWEREVRDLRTSMLFQEMVWPVVRA